MEFPREVTNVEEVVVDAASCDESALAGRDEVINERRSASTLVMMFAMPWIRLMGM
jgi:hypothetical protein